MAIVVVQIAKKIQKSCHAQSSISIAAHSQPAAAKTNSFENYFAAKKEFL